MLTNFAGAICKFMFSTSFYLQSRSFKNKQNTPFQSVCIEDNLFRKLETTFLFGEGLKGNNHTCTLHYDLAFEFRSALHSRMAHLFFNQGESNFRVRKDPFSGENDGLRLFEAGREEVRPSHNIPR